MSAVSLLLKIVGLIIGITALFLIAWKVFGASPTSDSVIITVISLLTALICANIALNFKMMYKMGCMETDLKHIKKMTYAIARNLRKHIQQGH